MRRTRRHRPKVLWRWILVCGVLCLAVAPTLPLVVTTVTQDSTRPLWTGTFVESVWQTLWLGVGVAALALLLGLPAGLLAAIYRFPGRSWLVPLQALPLLLPSFLPSIG